MSTARRTITARCESLPLKAPFRISGYTFTNSEVLTVTIAERALIGRGEASGVYYLDETPESMRAEVEAQRAAIEARVTRQDLQTLMPAGGARNALDCALWELEARQSGLPVWKLAGIESPRPLVTTFTLGADDPQVMANGARAFAGARSLKLKLTGSAEIDAQRVRAVRAAQPDVWLAVDANQGFTPGTLNALLPVLLDARVSLVEQPFARGRDADLDGFERPIPFAADESALKVSDVEGLVGRFDVVNIKLDKCGGLTEALEMAALVRRAGLEVMVGNMVASSWAMAPAFVLGQICDIADLDGPLFLKQDRSPGVVYEDGMVQCPDAVWGAPATDPGNDSTRVS